MNQIDVLASPARQQILIALQDGPLSFRSLCKATGIVGGTASHHLFVLCRHGLLRYERYQQFRFFGRTDQTWTVKDAMVTREPELLELTRLVGDARMHQKAILDALPWGRSTSQHRLQRAVRHGLLQEHWMGRRKVYSAVTAQ